MGDDPGQQRAEIGGGLGIVLQHKSVRAFGLKKPAKRLQMAAETRLLHQREGAQPLHPPTQSMRWQGERLFPIGKGCLQVVRVDRLNPFEGPAKS